MHSFHQSRGRILFDVLCTLGLAASFGGAWTQTGASAFIPAAVVSLLYGLVRLFDMRSDRAPKVATIEQNVDAPSAPADVAPIEATEEAAAAASAASIDERPETVEAAAPRPRARRQSKAPRKSDVRTAKAQKKASVGEAGEPGMAEPARAEEPVITVFAGTDDLTPPPPAPLFEPEPFVRQQRAVFGRKAG